MRHPSGHGGPWAGVTEGPSADARLATNTAGPSTFSLNVRSFLECAAQAFHTLYHSDVSVLLGAPTGSGKTISAELAMLRLFTAHPGRKASLSQLQHGESCCRALLCSCRKYCGCQGHRAIEPYAFPGSRVFDPRDVHSAAAAATALLRFYCRSSTSLPHMNIKTRVAGRLIDLVLPACRSSTSPHSRRWCGSACQTGAPASARPWGGAWWS